MSTIKPIWKDIYRHISETQETLYFYQCTDKEYYSLNSNFEVHKHVVARDGTIRKQLDLDMDNTSEDYVCMLMGQLYFHKNFVLSPSSQMRMCKSEVEAIQLSEPLRNQLRQLTSQIIGEENFRKGNEDFSEKGLNSKFSIPLGQMSKALLGWIEDVEEKEVDKNTNTLQLFYIYNLLYYEELIIEYFDTCNKQ